MDVTTLISDAGISFGTLTLGAALRALAILIVGFFAVKLILKALKKALGRAAAVS